MPGPAVVEVIARFGDAVVASRRIGGVPASTRPLGVGLALVGVGVALAVFEIATHRSVIMLPVDGVVAGLLIALVGLAAASVGWHRQAEPDALAFWLGQRSDVDLATVVPGLGADARLPVVRHTKAGIELRFVPGMRGALVRGDEATTLEALAADGPARADSDGSFGVPFGDADRAELSCGDITLLVQPADGVPAPKRGGVFDGRFAAATLLAAIVVGGTIAVAHFVVPTSRILPDQDDRPVVYPERSDRPPAWVYPPRNG